MKKYLLVVLAFALLMFTSVCIAADEVITETIVSEEPVVSEALGACPVPVGNGATTYVSTTTAVVLPEGPLEDVYYEVPVTKTIIADEIYTKMEKRSRTIHEVKVKTVKPNSARLARPVTPSRGVVAVMTKEKERQKVYLEPHKEQYEVPVTKTRKIKLQVEEKQLIPASKMKGHRW